MRKLYKLLLSLVFLYVGVPALLMIGLLIYSSIPYHRTYVADLSSIGCRMRMSEVEHDSILHFTFYRAHKMDSITFYTENPCFKYLYFIYKDSCDSIYMVNMYARDSDIPEDPRDKVKLKDFWRRNMSSKIIMINPYDTTYFRYNDATCHYDCRSEKGYHYFSIYHNTERGNSYSMLETTEQKTKEIVLKPVED